MTDTAPIQQCLDAGYVLIPLHPGTKQPKIRWGHLINSPPTHEEQLLYLAEQQPCDIGILTGKPSGIIALDYDAPPYPATGAYTRTPSGGRHYWYGYHKNDRHGLGVRPGLDIPHIIKLYALPVINTGRIPIQPQPHPESGKVRTDPWDEDSPDFSFIRSCSFIDWFINKRDDDKWEGRYPLARAYASNVTYCECPDTRLGNDYRHEPYIYRSLNRPIRCETISSFGYTCPHMSTFTGVCKLTGASTPYGFAIRLSKIHRSSGNR